MPKNEVELKREKKDMTGMRKRTYKTTSSVTIVVKPHKSPVGVCSIEFALIGYRIKLRI